ncbi:hypothetical protein ACP26L_34535 [Paenibacillus sp. S-38]|uniref:hypothetical protein n=1 Tax=Paenibacillus sp. S-38 TaxID=3416710 RepID=UPI003CF6BA9A
MLKLQIPKNRIKALARHLRDQFELERLERGWELFHKGLAQDMELKHGLEVHALVRDTKPAEVILNLETIPKSECSCSHGEHCEHQAAVVFALFVPHGRPELLLAQLKQAILVKNRQAQSRQGSTRTAEKKQEQRLEAPAPGQSPSLWQRFFDQQFYGFSLNQQSSIEQFYGAVKEKLSGHAEGWPAPLKELYALQLLLFVMRKIEQFYQETKTSYLSYYIETGCRTVGRQCHDELLTLVPRLDMEALTRKYTAQWKETLAMISEAALSGKESPLSWSTVYRSIWWRMPQDGPWMSAERSRLAGLLAASDLMPRRRDALIMAEAHFLVIEGDDEHARQRMEQLGRREAKDFFLYLHRCYEEEAWDRMLAWLRWLLPAVQRSQQDELRQFCHYWMEAVQRQPSDEEWIGIMVGLLPRTYPFYTAYLLKAKRHKAWIDLQMASRVSPMSLYSVDLQTVEREDPALVLPLYHQAVERAIAEKNRTAYATATKLLKKLHAFYKKLHRLPEWEDYIYRLAVKYSRLRALQEELKQGQWIP